MRKQRILEDKNLYSGSMNDFSKWLSAHKELDSFTEEEIHYYVSKILKERELKRKKIPTN